MTQQLTPDQEAKIQEALSHALVAESTLDIALRECVRTYIRRLPARATETYSSCGWRSVFCPNWKMVMSSSSTLSSFHRSQYIAEIVAAAGCEIWYLPTYSPDLNKIEHWWFVLKNWMRQRWDEFVSFRDCVDAAFKQCPNVLA